MTQKRLQPSRAVLCLVALTLGAGCGDSGEKPESSPPHGPPGGIVEVDPSSIPVNPGGSAGTAAATGGSGGNATSGNGGLAGGGSGGSAGSSGSAGSTAADTELFVPDVPNTYVGSIVVPGMEIVAHTLRESILGFEFLVAVKNVSADQLCAIDVDLTYFDAQGQEIGAGGTLLRVPIKRGCYGDCGFATCLGPGEIGMGTDQLGLSNLEAPSLIASVQHDFGALILIDAVPTFDIDVTDVQLAPDGERHFYSGQIDNNSLEPVRNPSISLFAVNSVGRPLAEARANALTTISAGGSWQFMTNSFAEAGEQYVAYPDVHDL